MTARRPAKTDRLRLQETADDLGTGGHDAQYGYGLVDADEAAGGGGGDDGGDGITLSVTAYKVRGSQYANVEWSGATSAEVDIYRDGSVAATTDNDGAHTDSTGQKGGGSATYRVCEADTPTCSNEVTVTW